MAKQQGDAKAYLDNTAELMFSDEGGDDEETAKAAEVISVVIDTPESEIQKERYSDILMDETKESPAVWRRTTPRKSGRGVFDYGY